MVSAAASTTQSVVHPTKEIARGVLWLAGTSVAVRFTEILVGRSPLGAALAGAVIVDLAMTRAGVRWDEQYGLTSNRSWSYVAKQIGIGVLVASVLVVVPVVLSAIVGGATISATSPSSTILFGLLRGGAVGVRDELLYRGLPLLVAARAGVSTPIAVVYAALAGASTLGLEEGLSAEALVLSASQGALFAMLWVRTNAAWASVAAHAAWVFLAGAALRGGFLEVAWNSGMLADGTRARGLPALVCAVVAVLLTALVSKKFVTSSESAHDRSAS